MPRTLSVDDIINRTALEVGLLPSNSPVNDTDESFVQMVGLLNSAGQELIDYFPWQELVKVFSLTTSSADTGTYPLPDDFNYMIDQTGWDRTNRVAIGGPLSAQDWTYLEGRDLVSQSIYASFRLADSKFDLYPQPPPDGLEITFEYIGRNWLAEQGQTEANRDSVGAGSDICILDPLLVIKFLKVKFLEAKGFDPSSARLEFENIFNSRTGKDTGASILSASNNSRGFPYLHPYYNTADTGYGGGVP